MVYGTGTAWYWIVAEDPEWLHLRLTCLIFPSQSVHSTAGDRIGLSLPGKPLSCDRFLTDRERIQGFLAGSRPHYDEIVGWITLIVRSRLWEDHIAAEDVIADTVTKLLMIFQDDAFRFDSSLKTYVQQVTLYTLIDATRRQKRFVALDLTVDPPASGTPLADLEKNEEALLVDRIVAHLPAACRALFDLVLDERLTCREIAARMGSTEGAIKTRLSRCRQKAVDLMQKMR
jgi:RNA polymerase sigma factor (sigma-70 family)